MYGSRLQSLSSPTHPPFCHCCRPCPVRDRFVRNGSTPPALAAVDSGDRRFGRALDDDADGLPSQRRLLRAHRPCSSPSSLLSSSSSQNAPPKVGRGLPPRNRARTPPSITGIGVVTIAGCCGDRVEEDPVRQDEEGAIQAASGVGAVTSVALLLLRRRHRRRHRRRCSCSVAPDGGSDDAAGPERPL